MNLRSATYVIAREVRNSILDNKAGFEDEDNVTTNTSNDSKRDFDESMDDIFDLILGTDYNTADDFIDRD